MTNVGFKRMPTDFLLSVTEAANERNIYVHPNCLARDIFWKRLEKLFNYIYLYTRPTDNVLDFGGGSGAFIPSLCEFFSDLTVVDLDVEDAVSISRELGIENVKIIQQDIFSYFPEKKFDVVILADVLEHFQDLDAPIRWLRKNLNIGGKVFVSLPTENWIYELGRKVVGKEKPKDHFHSSKHVLAKLRKNNFSVVDKSFIPKYVLPIPLFEIAVLINMGSSHDGSN